MSALRPARERAGCCNGDEKSRHNMCIRRQLEEEEENGVGRNQVCQR